jgi:hypothetical protein
MVCCFFYFLLTFYEQKLANEIQLESKLESS